MELGTSAHPRPDTAAHGSFERELVWKEQRGGQGQGVLRNSDVQRTRLDPPSKAFTLPRVAR